MPPMSNRVKKTFLSNKIVYISRNLFSFREHFLKLRNFKKGRGNFFSWVHFLGLRITFLYFLDLRSPQPVFKKLAKSHISAQFFVRVFVCIRVVHIF